jgi:hypothetical protein
LANVFFNTGILDTKGLFGRVVADAEDIKVLGLDNLILQEVV